MCLEQLGGRRTGCSTLMWCVPTWVKLAPMDGGFSQLLGGLGGGLDSCNAYGLSVWVFGWCVWMMGGGALGRTKDSIHCCGLLSGGGMVAWGVWGIFCFSFGWQQAWLFRSWWVLRFDLASSREA